MTPAGRRSSRPRWSTRACCAWRGRSAGSTKGHFGDLVAVKGDPLANIRLLEQPVFVMKEGVVALKK